MSEYPTEEIDIFLRAANSNLGLRKYSGDDMIPDYCKAVNIGKQLSAQLSALRTENDKLREAAERCLQPIRDAILFIPTGSTRNQLTVANILLRAALSPQEPVKKRKECKWCEFFEDQTCSVDVCPYKSQ